MQTSIVEKIKQREELNKLNDFRKQRIYINDLDVTFKILIGEEELKVESLVTSEGIIKDLLKNMGKLESALEDIRDMEGIDRDSLMHNIRLFVQLLLC